MVRLSNMNQNTVVGCSVFIYPHNNKYINEKNKETDKTLPVLCEFLKATHLSTVTGQLYSQSTMWPIKAGQSDLDLLYSIVYWSNKNSSNGK